MLLKRTCQLLMLLNASLIVIAAVFFVLSTEKAPHKENDLLSSLRTSYALILAGFENGNLQAEPDNFFLTLYKWSAFLNDLIKEIVSACNNTLAIERYDGAEWITHNNDVLSITHNNEKRLQLMAIN